MTDYRELLIGCGNHREKIIASPERRGWENLTTLDFDPNCGAEVEWDLTRLPLPFDGSDIFDEIHAYHVLEHTGPQGDWRFFFAQFSDFYRLLKPAGLFCFIVPAPDSIWVWGDPGHTRAFRPELMNYLDQAQYEKQVGKTAFADYRHVWKGDFVKMWEEVDGDKLQYMCALKAIKPAGFAMAERLA